MDSSHITVVTSEGTTLRDCTKNIMYGIQCHLIIMKSVINCATLDYWRNPANEESIL